jgi:hypothetical protein
MDQKRHRVIGIVSAFALCGLLAALAARWMVYPPEYYIVRAEWFEIWLIGVNLVIAVLIVGRSVGKWGWKEALKGVFQGICFLPFVVFFSASAEVLFNGHGWGVLRFTAPVVCVGMSIYLLAEGNYAWATALILEIIEIGGILLMRGREPINYHSSQLLAWSSLFVWVGMLFIPLSGSMMMALLEWRRNHLERAAVYLWIASGFFVWTVFQIFYDWRF